MIFTIEINGNIITDDNGNALHFKSYKDATKFIKDSELENAIITRQ